MTTTNATTRILTIGDIMPDISLFSHWRANGDIVDLPTYNVADFFDDGAYIGPDCYGVEPVFSIPVDPLDDDSVAERIGRDLACLLYLEIKQGKVKTFAGTKTLAGLARAVRDTMANDFVGAFNAT